MTLLREGQNVRGTYEVERFLGSGAFAEVYRVRHRFLGRQAMKVFRAVGMSTKETEDLLSEAVLLSRLGHPNIIRVYDANTAPTSSGEYGFFTMEYVAGGSLEQYWRSHGAQFVPVDTSVEIIRQVCRGLAVAHGEAPPIIHRDVKPQNILVGYDPGGLRVRLADFGLAKKVNPLTLLASARGTRCFKAPEAFCDSRSDSCASDVWAVGCTLYLLLTDRLPYFAVDESENCESPQFDLPLVPPSRLNAQSDQALDRLVARALAVDPQSRHRNAQEMLQDLMGWKACTSSRAGKAEMSSADSKSVLGAHSPVDEGAARRLATQAIELARNAGRLHEAADLMEEACNRAPGLRTEYEYQIQLWRRGIVM